jgi:serine/threonine-protein kinase HipA
MTSTSTSDRAYVWVWLPGAHSPVPAGVLARRGGVLQFHYGEDYLARPDAISLYAPELPLGSDWIRPLAGLTMPSCLRDASPDAWGRRVILNRLTGQRGHAADVDHLDELTYLLESGSNRIGGLDFQVRPDAYTARSDTATLDDLQQAADLVEAGQLLPPTLAEALVHGTSVGGARPKVLLEADGRHWIAKFSTSTDPYPVIGSEAVALELARRVGLTVPLSQMVRSLGRDVLLVERFDRPPDGTRRLMVSALTLLGLDEMAARYGSYPAVLDVLRAWAPTPHGLGARLFQRIAFNVAISNTDDHLRNHAAFWDGVNLDLTPAYDLSPMLRSGDTARQAIAYDRTGRRDAVFAGLIAAAPEYDLTRPDARAMIDALVETIRATWTEAADAARLTQSDRAYLWGRQILNRASFYDSL